MKSMKLYRQRAEYSAVFSLHANYLSSPIAWVPRNEISESAPLLLILWV